MIQLTFGDVQLPAEIRHIQRLGEVLFRIFPQDEGKIPAAAADALIVNRDPDWIFGALKGETKEEMQAAIEQYFSMFGGYGITDLALCVYSQLANVPSGYVCFMGDHLNTLSEYSETDPYRPIVRNLNRCWYEFGLDPVKTCIDMMRGFGIRPWLTMRMNDATMGGGESLMRDDIFDEELAAGHMIGDQYGYYGRCFDYTYPRIRRFSWALSARF